MSESKDGGSGSNSGTTDAANQGQAAGAQKNKTVKMSMDQALAEVERLTKESERKDGIITDLTQQLDEANKVLEGQQKAKLIGEILPRSSFKLDELAGRSVEELQSVLATLDQAMPPKVHNARFGLDLTDREKGLTIGDLSVVTAEKRKRAREAA